jgi:hypothetical protein
LLRTNFVGARGFGTKGTEMTATLETQVATTAQFRAFEILRVTQLVNSGMQIESARAFAKEETLSRARASFSHGVEQALRAELQLVEQPGRPEPQFRLVYPPIA